MLMGSVINKPAQHIQRKSDESRQIIEGDCATKCTELQAEANRLEQNDALSNRGTIAVLRGQIVVTQQSTVESLATLTQKTRELLQARATHERARHDAKRIKKSHGKPQSEVAPFSGLNLPPRASPAGAGAGAETRPAEELTSQTLAETFVAVIPGVLSNNTVASLLHVSMDTTPHNEDVAGPFKGAAVAVVDQAQSSVVPLAPPHVSMADLERRNRLGREATMKKASLPAGSAVTEKAIQ